MGVNAAPMMTPMARSMTLPFIAKFLNSSHISFIGGSLGYGDRLAR